MNDKIIPFGKYKGQPVEVLQNDKQYLDWLQTQDWFKRDYQQFNTVIINNFQEPTETPEHNKLCNLFLDDDFCLKFANAIIDVYHLPKIYTHKIEKPKTYNERPRPTFIPNSGRDTIKIPSLKDIVKSPELLKDSPDDIKTEPLIIKVSESAVFEENGVDVKFYTKSQKGITEYCIEVKPNVGDDYPAILRQIASNKCGFLFIDKFTATGATFRQVREIFSRSNNRILLLSEIL